MSEVPLYPAERNPPRLSDKLRRCSENHAKRAESHPHAETPGETRFESCGNRRSTVGERCPTEMCSGSEAGSYSRIIDVCITQL